jgi:hypothetical protein
MTNRKASTPTPLLKAPDKNLAAWLTEQGSKLKSLEARGQRLKLNFVGNARDKGRILLEVKDRLAGTLQQFKTWVTENTDIGYSTALLWMDVARNYEDLMNRFADSNPLELTLRQLRDATRDARQERGEGKPGSGRRTATTTATQAISGLGDDHTDDPADRKNAPETDEDDAPDRARWERAAATAEAEEAAIEGGQNQQTQTPAETSPYKVTVMLSAESDQHAIQHALSAWSPTSKTSAGNQLHRSVSAHVQPRDMVLALNRLGKVLQSNEPKCVRVSIER